MAGPKIGKQDEFEGLYTEKFRDLARPFGEFIKYERDRAAIDIGVHLTESTPRFRTVSNTRVWFQLKGIQNSTLGLHDFDQSPDVALDLDISDLRFWYASPEAVYLAVYVECADLFLVEDIRDVIDRQWGETIFNDATFKPGQTKARVRVLKRGVLNDDVWRQMLNHRSIRIDGPSFRGRPLGHRLDPLRCSLKPLEPAVFTQIVERLLAAHGYQVTDQLDPKLIFPSSDSSGDVISLSTGIMRYTYEWVLQLTTEFGFDENTEFRIEGEILHVQGPCAVLVHSDKRSYPDTAALTKFARELASSKEIPVLLVFANGEMDAGYFGSYFGNVRGTGVRCIPQMLGEVAFQLLTCTTVYMDSRDKVSWQFVNYLY